MAPIHFLGDFIFNTLVRERTAYETMLGGFPNAVRQYQECGGKRAVLPSVKGITPSWTLKAWGGVPYFSIQSELDAISLENLAHRYYRLDQDGKMIEKKGFGKTCTVLGYDYGMPAEGSCLVITSHGGMAWHTLVPFFIGTSPLFDWILVDTRSPLPLEVQKEWMKHTKHLYIRTNEDVLSTALDERVTPISTGKIGKVCVENSVIQITDHYNLVSDIGCGDSFTGALAYALSEGVEIEKACLYALRVAALRTTLPPVLPVTSSMLAKRNLILE